VLVGLGLVAVSLIAFLLLRHFLSADPNYSFIALIHYTNRAGPNDYDNLHHEELIMRSLIPLIEEGEKIAASDATAPRDFRERCAAWAKKVIGELEDDPLALARFTTAKPFAHDDTVIPFGIAVHWRRLKGQLAVLIELEKERPKAMTFKPGAYGDYTNPKAILQNLKAWWKRPRAR
jgi:hypothetical protein